MQPEPSNNKLVSAVITTHNRRDLVLKAIDSVFAQTYPDMELIVVDDASGDATRDILTPLANERGFKYIYIPKEESKGGNHARNVGVLSSKGAYIAFLDDDDEWLPEKTAKQVEYLEEHPDCLLVHCGFITETNFRKRKYSDLTKLAEGDHKRDVLTRIATTTTRLMVRRELFDKIGLFDENLKFWQERELMIRAAQVSDVGLVREHLALYRVLSNDSGRLTNKLKGWEDAVEYIAEKHADLMADFSAGEKRKYELMVARDGMLRAYNCGDKRARRKYLKRIYELDPNPKNLAKYLLNVRRLRFWKG